MFGGINNYSSASDEELLISSGKGILRTWEDVLSKGYIGVS